MKFSQKLKNLFIIIIDFLAIFANLMLIIQNKLIDLILGILITIFLTSIIYPEIFSDFTKVISFVFLNYGSYIYIFLFL